MTPQSNLVWVPDNDKFEGGEFATAFGFQYLIFDSGYIMSNPATKFISTQVTIRPKQDCESHHAAILGAIKEAVEENQRKNNVAIDLLIKSQPKDNYNAAIEEVKGEQLTCECGVSFPAEWKIVEDEGDAILCPRCAIACVAESVKEKWISIATPPTKGGAYFVWDKDEGAGTREWTIGYEWPSFITHWKHIQPPKDNHHE